MPERGEVIGEGTEGLLVGEVVAKAPFAAERDGAGIAENAEVLGDGAEGDVELPGDVAGGALAIPDESEDLLAARFGDDAEQIGHVDIIALTKILCNHARAWVRPRGLTPGSDPRV